jgi:hypothetical protein
MSTYIHNSSLLEEAQIWNCKLYAKGYTSRNSFNNKELPVEVDICELMSNRAVLFPLLSKPMSHFMFNPADIKGCSKDDKKVMYSIIQNMCKAAGFDASPTGNCSKKADKFKLASLEFACKHRQKNKRNGTWNDDSCPFRLRVFCYRGDECWYLSPQTYNDHIHPSLHKGHHQLMPQDVCTPLNSIGQNEIKCKKQSNNQEHYAKVMAQMKDIVKVCEGDEDLWNDFHNSLNDILIHVTRIKCKK